MVKNFEHYLAWTDAMRCEFGFAGLICYQRKTTGNAAYVLWVLGPNLKCEYDAECSAEIMLEQIADINRFGHIIYADGIML